MVLKELLRLLRKIKQAHPEAANAEVWSYAEPTSEAPGYIISYVGYDKRRKPNRIKLEQ